MNVEYTKLRVFSIVLENELDWLDKYGKNSEYHKGKICEGLRRTEVFDGLCKSKAVHYRLRNIEVDNNDFSDNH